ncbi:hypothetical protein GCM10010080_27850 [Thermomonas carbonis]|nr:hypothetical protein GCM10010080_27850 [Thermomonas carbonis]
MLASTPEEDAEMDSLSLMQDTPGSDALEAELDALESEMPNI